MTHQTRTVRCATCSGSGRAYRQSELGPEMVEVPCPCLKLAKARSEALEAEERGRKVITNAPRKALPTPIHFTCFTWERTEEPAPRVTPEDFAKLAAANEAVDAIGERTKALRQKVAASLSWPRDDLGDEVET